MKLCVIGLGLIGGSLAKDLRHLSFATHLLGVDQNEKHGAEALNLGLVDELSNFSDAVKSADVIVLSIPVNGIAELLPKVLDQISNSAVVIDMGSTKQEICQRVVSHPKRRQFVASHPMAGTENSGPGASVLGLFNGKTTVICEKEKTGSHEFETAKTLFEALGMRLVFMSAEEHDLHVAYVSHLSHISSFVLANTVLDIEKKTLAIFDLASGGFESTVRLAKSSPGMWGPIFEQNKTHVSNALGAYIKHLENFKLTIDQGQFDKSIKLMERANEIRRVLQEIEKK